MIAMKSVRLATVVFAGTVVMAGSAFAETSWERNHPRRDQVNDRLQTRAAASTMNTARANHQRLARALHSAARCAARSAMASLTAATSPAPTSARSTSRRI
jgi:hypothetical protein